MAHVAFARHLRERLPPGVDEDTALGAVALPDLYLACGCMLGDRRALATFRARFGPAVRAAIARAAPSSEVDDLQQQVMTSLFVGERPKIGKYSGRGQLSTWVQTVASREAISAMRKKRPAVVEDDVIIQQAIESDDPELEALKRRYRAEFKQAFQRAFSELEPRQRNLLRHEYIDGMSIERISKLYSVHRVTASRWRSEIRRALLTRTRAIFEQDFRVSADQMKSIMRLLKSQMDVSLSRLLRTPTPEP